MYYYSQSTGGFYTDELHGTDLPPDAVEVSAAEHHALMQAQAAGQIILPDADGRPMAVAAPPPSDAEQAASARAERDARISAISWRYERHARELRLGLSSTDDLAALDAYVQALVDVPKQPGFPSEINWPVQP